MKSNMDFLRQYIEDNNEALEFYDAVCKEIEEDKDEIKDLKGSISINEERIRELEEDFFKVDNDGFALIEDMEVIDCAIGEIRYIQPDNLKLRILMEEFKERHEHAANFV